MQTEDPRVNVAINDDAYQYAADGSKVYLNAPVAAPVEAPASTTTPASKSSGFMSDSEFAARSGTVPIEDDTLASYAKYESLAKTLNDDNVSAYRTSLKDTPAFKSNPTPSVSVPVSLSGSVMGHRGTVIVVDNDNMESYVEMMQRERRELMNAVLDLTKCKSQPQPEPQPKYKPWGLGDVFQELMDRELDIEALYVKAVSMGVPPQVMEFVQGQIEYKSQSRMYLASILNFIANSSVAGADVAQGAER